MNYKINMNYDSNDRTNAATASVAPISMNPNLRHRMLSTISINVPGSMTPTIGHVNRKRPLESSGSDRVVPPHPFRPMTTTTPLSAAASFATPVWSPAGSPASSAGSVSSSSAGSSSASSASCAPTPPKRAEYKNTISSPQDFFTAMLKARGYPATTFCSLKCGYHNMPTKHQMTSYGVSFTKAIRSSDAATARDLLAAGLHPNACNKFGESIIHAACRRGDYAMLRTLVDAGSSVQVADDFGRTPLHDACWTSSPNFDAIRLLLDEDPWLLCVVDCRGSTPLGYARKAHWAVWIGFLGAIADRYWPNLDDGDQGERGEQPEDDAVVERRVRIPPLGDVEPNSRPLPDPTINVLDLAVVELLANGKLTPQDLKGNDTTNGFDPALFPAPEGNPASSSARSRITLDPLRQSGANGTTMLKNSVSAAAALMQGFVQVSASAPQQVCFVHKFHSK